MLQEKYTVFRHLSKSESFRKMYTKRINIVINFQHTFSNNGLLLICIGVKIRYTEMVFILNSRVCGMTGRGSWKIMFPPTF